MVALPLDEVELTSVTPETPVTARSIGDETSSATICGVAPGYVAVTIAVGTVVEGSSSCLRLNVEISPKTTIAMVASPTIRRLARLHLVRCVMGVIPFTFAVAVGSWSNSVARARSSPTEHPSQHDESNRPAQTVLSLLTTIQGRKRVFPHPASRPKLCTN